MKNLSMNIDSTILRYHLTTSPADINLSVSLGGGEGVFAYPFRFQFIIYTIFNHKKHYVKQLKREKKNWKQKKKNRKALKKKINKKNN